MVNKLKKFRKEIDKVDAKIAGLLDKRAEIVKKVGKEKKRLKITVVNASREKEVLKRVSAGRKNKRYIKSCFIGIIKESRNIQK